MIKSVCEIWGSRGKLVCSWDGIIKNEIINVEGKMKFSLSLSSSWLIHMGLYQCKKQKIYHGRFKKEEGGQKTESSGCVEH